MKKMNAILGAGLVLFTLLAGAVSCNKVQTTELSADNLPVKSIACGHIRLFPWDNNGVPKENKMAAQAGLLTDVKINIFYGIPDDKGNVSYALKQVKTNQNGFFEAEIGCPPGKTLKVKAVCRILSTSMAKNEDGTSVQTEAWFYGEVQKEIPCGKSVYFKLDMEPSANTQTGGLVQPK